MIEAHLLTKRYGTTTAVEGLTFQVRPGQVTGFLGPNGSGKSTTMRMIMGLDRPSSGRVTIDGRPYGDLRFPLHRVGALLDAHSAHPGRSARNHLTWLAQSNAISQHRVDEVLAAVGLTEVGDRRAGTFSLGMGQRLGIAAALLGDPDTVIFDEPINGLDPEGILWVRQLLRRLAVEGRTVLVSSHLMSEMALTADHLIVIGRGRLLALGSVQELIDAHSDHRVAVRCADAPALARLLTAHGARVTAIGAEQLQVTGIRSRQVGMLAGAAQLTLYELTEHRASLEDAFLDLTQEHAEYQARPTSTSVVAA